MKNFDDVLSLSTDTNPDQIKKAFHQLAIDTHPDKHVDGAEIIIINEALEVLSDPEQICRYNLAWHAYQDTPFESVSTSSTSAQSKFKPFSNSCRQEHDLNVLDFKRIPVLQESTPENFFQLDCSLYKNSNNLFEFLQKKQHEPCQDIQFKQSFDLSDAVQWFQAFLRGEIYSTNLVKLAQHFLNHMTLQLSPQLPILKPIIEILLLSQEAEPSNEKLILALEKLSNDAKKTDSSSIHILLPLFHCKYFRFLNTFALNKFWIESKPQNIRDLDGLADTRALLVFFNEKARHFHDDHVKPIRSFLTVLHDFESQVHYTNLLGANDIRELAFNCLDWLSKFQKLSHPVIISNIYLTIGMRFQQASTIEPTPEIQMADEALAKKMYCLALTHSKHSTPDHELYILSHVLKNLIQFRYLNQDSFPLMQELRTRALSLIDIFPISQSLHSNILNYLQHYTNLNLMRHLLNFLMGIIQYNKTHQPSKELNHSQTRILYQLYEACLKKWYPEINHSEFENTLRIELMNQLLQEHSWSFIDVEQNINSLWITANRDKDGWFIPSRRLAINTKSGMVQYRQFNGASLNRKTGQINFYLEPWSKDYPEYEQRFSLFDLQEMVQKNLGTAILSLEPVDFNNPYQPFNQIQFHPPQLANSQLSQCMLLTNQMLQFFTTNLEMQAQYPFKQRSVVQMITHLPDYLKKIITDYHQSTQHGTAHRFWIDAEEIDLEQFENDETIQFAIKPINLVIKKNKMKRSLDGQIHDTDHENEGWPIYVLSEKQWEALKKGELSIDTHAMIFIDRKRRVYFWENNREIQCHMPQQLDESLVRLYQLPRSPFQQVICNAKTLALIYRITKKITHQAHMTHRYSAEFIFAQEFTNHYDEFAQYFPEFGRLKELSKISTLVRILSNKRETNILYIKAVDAILNHQEDSQNVLYSDIFHGFKDQCLKIKEMLLELNQQCSHQVLKEKALQFLTKLRKKMGSMELDESSPEFKSAQVEYYTQLSKLNPSSPLHILEEQINSKKRGLIQHLSEVKYQLMSRQLHDILVKQLPLLGKSTLDMYIKDFLNNNQQPLIDALTEYNHQFALEHSAQHFTDMSQSDISKAIDEPEKFQDYFSEQSSKNLLKNVKLSKLILELGFQTIGLKLRSIIHEDDTQQDQDKCSWIPATSRHELISKHNRLSFFGYGGVSIQPRINPIPQNTILKGTPINASHFQHLRIDVEQRQPMNGPHSP